MRTDQAMRGQAIAVVGRLDQQEPARPRGLQAPHGAARQHDVIAFGIGQVAEIAEPFAVAVMYEQQLLAVAVSDPLVTSRRQQQTPVFYMGCADTDGKTSARERVCREMMLTV